MKALSAVTIKMDPSTGLFRKYIRYSQLLILLDPHKKVITSYVAKLTPRHILISSDSRRTLT